MYMEKNRFDYKITLRTLAGFDIRFERRSKALLLL